MAKKNLTEKLWNELSNASSLPDDYEVDGQLSMFDDEYAKYMPDSYLSNQQKELIKSDDYKAVLYSDEDK